MAHILFHQLLEEIAARAGSEWRLLPLNYERILRTGEGNALSLQVFPDVGPDLRDALYGLARPGLLMSAIRKHRAELEAAHLDVDVPMISGHWRRAKGCSPLSTRFRNDSKQYQYWKAKKRLPRDHEMCSMRFKEDVSLSQIEALVLSRSPSRAGSADAWLDRSEHGAVQEQAGISKHRVLISSLGGIISTATVSLQRLEPSSR